MRAPLIGITAYPYVMPGHGWDYDICYRGNARAVERAGGLPILIPAALEAKTLRGLFDRVDGILLPGGGDVNPQRYHETPHPTIGGVNDIRDTAEALLTQWSVEDNRPIFGICRGMQIMNVALGGSLVQDIPSEIDTTLRHDIHDGEPRSTILHTIQIADDTRLAQILGASSVQVNSLHHQSVETPAPIARIIATAPDGVAEALEVPDHAFAMAVQWHPEDMLDSGDGRMQKLFDAFVQAVRDTMAARES